MKKNQLLLSLFGFCFFMQAASQLQTGTAVFKKMHERYAGKWYQTFTFRQTTEFYRNDSLIKTETWYESLAFPDRFRIDLGSIDSGNSIIFKGDSVYRFRRGKLVIRRKDSNELTFLLGGMYFFDESKAEEKFRELGYDLSKMHEAKWNDKPVWVIGAATPGEKVNQLWIDQEKNVLVRMLKFNDVRNEDGRFDAHIRLAGGWTETKVTFYFDNKLAQKEQYHDCKANIKLDDRLFDPEKYGEWHWMNKKKKKKPD